MIIKTVQNAIAEIKILSTKGTALYCSMETKTVDLGTLAPSSRFLIPGTGRTGTLVSISLGSARVQYDAIKKEKTLEGAPHTEDISVETYPINIGVTTQVVLLGT